MSFAGLNPDRAVEIELLPLVLNTYGTIGEAIDVLEVSANGRAIRGRSDTERLKGGRLLGWQLRQGEFRLQLAEKGDLRVWLENDRVEWSICEMSVPSRSSEYPRSIRIRYDSPHLAKTVDWDPLEFWAVASGRELRMLAPSEDHLWLTFAGLEEVMVFGATVPSLNLRMLKWE